MSIIVSLRQSTLSSYHDLQSRSIAVSWKNSPSSLNPDILLPKKKVSKINQERTDMENTSEKTYCLVADVAQCGLSPILLFTLCVRACVRASVRACTQWASTHYLVTRVTIPTFTPAHNASVKGGFHNRHFNQFVSSCSKQMSRFTRQTEGKLSVDEFLLSYRWYFIVK